MEITPKILIVSSDPTLAREVDAALNAISDIRSVAYAASDYRKGVDMARSRRPDLALVEVTADLTALKTLVDEMNIASPNTSVVAVFHPTVFGRGISESAFIIDAIRAGVKDFLRRPISTGDVDQFLDRQFRKKQISNENLGHIITFFTNKGGVGKSTLSMSTACMLAKRYPGKVLLVDASIQMGVCSAMLDLRPKTTITDAVRERDRLDATLVRELSVAHSSGLHLLASPMNALEAAMIDDDVFARVLNLARRTFKYVVVDTFPMIDRVMIAGLDLCSRAYLVTESVVPTLEGTARMMEVLDELGFPRSKGRLVLNRYSNFVGNIRADEVSRRMGLKIDHIVPYEKKLLISANIGSPFVLQSGNSKFKKAIEKIVEEVLAIPSIDASTPGTNGHHPSLPDKPSDKVEVNS